MDLILDEPTVVAVQLTESIKKVVKDNEVLFYLLNPESYRRLMAGLENGALRKSCCVQGNIITAKSTTVASFNASPMQTFREGGGMPLCVSDQNELTFYLVPTDIFNAMIGVK